MARSAGTVTARSATSISETPTLTSVNGSVGSTPNRIVRMPFITANDAPSPSASPIAACKTPSPST